MRGGMLAVEVGQGQSRAVEALFERAGLRAVETTGTSPGFRGW